MTARVRPRATTNMDASALTPKSAWLPITPRGVAAFAAASNGRLWLVQLLFALITAGTFGWLIHVAWIPPVRDAIKQLPAGAQIEGGILAWPTNSPMLLAEGHFLAFAVDLEHSAENVATSHFQVELGRRDWQVSSLLGVLDAPAWVKTTYPTNRLIALDRATVEPWWGAREPFVILLAMVGVVVYLMSTWALLALIYSIPVWLTGFYANRAVTWRGCWRLAGAALMPGALMVSVGIVLYGWRMFDLVKFGFTFALHLVVGWLYIFVSPLFLPRNPEVPAADKNPFASEP